MGGPSTDRNDHGVGGRQRRRRVFLHQQHLDGQHGTSMDLYGICGVSANQVVAVGHDAAEANGQMTGFNGSSWTAGGIITGAPALYDVACAGINVMAVGKDARVYDCASTCIANANFHRSPDRLATRSGSPPSASGMGQDIWVAGSNGTLFRHQTGTNSRTLHGNNPAPPTHFGKTIPTCTSSVMAGRSLKWNGSSFSVVKTDTAQRLQAGTVFPSGNSAFIGGPMAGWLHQIP